MRDKTEAHYLHERSGLEAVLRPPVPEPTALAWVPGVEELVVGTGTGELVSVDPVMGTQLKAKALGWVSSLAIHANRKLYIVLAERGAWQVGELGGDKLAAGVHGFEGNMSAFFMGDHAVIAGDTATGRAVSVITGGRQRVRIDVPRGAVLAQGANGKLVAARSTPAGLEVLPFGKNTRFSEHDATGHRVSITGQHMLGFTITGLCVWALEGKHAHSMRFPGMSAGCISADGQRVGLGTTGGAVGFAFLDSIDARVHPDLVKAFEEPVRAVAFSTKGRWLASAAEAVQLWSWEED